MSKVGRNKLCPCGSGKKSKKCCGDTPAIPPQAHLLAEQFNERANNLADRGLFEEAIRSYEMALDTNPKFAGAWNNLGIIYKTMGRFSEAVSCYNQALAIQPDFAGVHNNLGNAFKEWGRLDEAIAAYHSVLALTPDCCEACFGLGNAWLDKGKRKEAMRWFRRSFAIKPDAVVLNGIIMNSLYEFSPTGEELFAGARDFGRLYETPLKKVREAFYRLPTDNDRLRVGFVSADLRNHSVGFFLENVLRHLNRELLELHAYANHLTFDSLSERIRPHFDKWTVVAGMTDEQLAEQIHEDKVDLLVDLSGHSADNRLLTFARKPAPVQVAWLGYPATSGLKSMDYILADPVTLPPEEEHFYSEKPWHLPETYVCFTQPDFDLPVTELPALRNGYITFGSCNNPLKLNDEVVCCWSDILHAVPDSRLLLNYRTMAKEWSREICRDRFRKCGIAADRLRFASGSTRVEYLATYGQIDIGLDPFPYGGMTTTCEALWMGVPTVTLRMARGMYAHSGELVMKSIGLNDWVTGSVEEYRERVVALAGNPGWLAPLRRSLRAALLASPLCDAERFARNLEEAFHGMVRLSAHVTK